MKKKLHITIYLIIACFVLSSNITANGAAIKTHSGDVNGDGEVNTSDLSSLIACILDPSAVTSLPKYLSDLIYDMVQVQGGVFNMGATWDQGKSYSADERPIHSVTLSPYKIERHEVTQEIWEQVMDYNPSYFQGKSLPVEQVSYDECLEFIDKLRHLTGYDFRLPTEAEWEYAARGGFERMDYMYSGDDDIEQVAWYAGNSGGITHEVGHQKANELDLYNMSGNVREWCDDLYSPYSSTAQTNPTGGTQHRSHVVRGGGWNSTANECRNSHREALMDIDFKNDLGLRLVIGNKDTGITPETSVLADVNGDGNVDTTDLSALMTIILGNK